MKNKTLVSNGGTLNPAIITAQKSYFTIDELCKSDTAKLWKIDNTPSEEIKKNLQQLIAFLNPLREAWGSGIKITSGYRCPELNRKVGGSKTSVHVKGWAADLQPINGKMKEFKEFVVKYLTTKNVKWDQCLRETSAFAEWIHIGIYNNNGQQRKQIKDLNV